MEEYIGCSCGCCSAKKKTSKVSIIKTFIFELLKIFIGAIMIVLALIFGGIYSNVLCVLTAILCGYEIIYSYVKNVFKGEVFNENALMILASVVAFIIGEHFEGGLIILLFFTGETFEQMATYNTEKKIAGIAKLRADVAHHVTKNGVFDVLPEKVNVGDIIEVRQGEEIPIDGILIAGTAEIDAKNITGESEIKTLKFGEKIYSGSICVGSPILIRTTKLFKDSTVEKIIETVEKAKENKGKAQRFITSFAKIYTPIVGIIALFIGGIVPLFDSLNFNKWIFKALSFLVVSCPCALVISVPLAYFVGVGSFAQNGILIKGGEFIEKLSSANLVVFDKTGTLTEGLPYVYEYKVNSGFDKETLANYVVSVENKSNHPISKAICSYFNLKKVVEAKDVVVKTGLGISGLVDNKEIHIGNYNFINESFPVVKINDENKTCVYVVVDGKFAGYLLLKDKVKDGSKVAVQNLKKLGVNNLAILSGDNDSSVKDVANSVGIETFSANLLPQQKLDKFNALKDNIKSNSVYVGDGVNDLPVMVCSDVGIAMGGLGSDLATQNADVVIMDDDVNKIPFSIKFSKKVRNIVRINVIFSLFTKFLVMVLGLMLTVPIYLAMFADVGVMTLAVLNSILSCKSKYK